MLTIPVLESCQVTPRAYRVRLDLDGHSFPFLAGQAVLVGAHGDSKRRAYSIASAPAEATRDSVLELLVGVAEVGSPPPFPMSEPHRLVDVEGPVGRFTLPLDDADRRHLFIAGGTGIAPLRAMLRQALNAPDREIRLIYSARTSEDFAYKDELRLLAQSGQIDLHLMTTRASGPDEWTPRVGRLDRAEIEHLVQEPTPSCFVCGPMAFVAHTYRILGGLGVPEQKIKVEEHVLKMLNRLE